MKDDAIEKALEALPLYAAILCGRDGSSASARKGEGLITIPKSKEREVERMARSKAASPDDPENGLAMAFKLHLKGGDLLQRDFRSYHYSRVCWSLLMREADRLRRDFKLP